MRADRRHTIEDLIRKGLTGLSHPRALGHIGSLIDLSSDLKSSAGTARCFELLDEVEKRKLPPGQAAFAHYLRANAWHNKDVERRGENPDVWAWEQPEIQAQILELRKAVQHPGFEQVDSPLRCMIFTNLANQLSFIGRFIEAAEMWDRALAEEKTFAMALGNHGIGLATYAQALYDPGHAKVMRTAAHDLLTAALSKNAKWDGGGYAHARAEFSRFTADIEAHLDVAAVRKAFRRNYSIGKSSAERNYRKWCLANRLFINPLNDLGPVSIAATDVLTLPTLTTPIEASMPWIIGFFNQMKQEYVSARFLLYDGLRRNSVHFSDRAVLLYNTLDYPSYSIAVEQQRAAFRMAYSVLDKIGFFLSDYLAIGLNPRAVSFSRLWFETKGTAKPKPLLDRFKRNENWVLRGLFWLSRDLFDDDLQASTEPDAQALDEIRNRLEHRYLQVHELSLTDRGRLDGSVGSEHRYSISRDELAIKSLRLLKTTRSALIYLALAVNYEERIRAKASKGVAMPMFIDTWSDDWKQ